MTNALAYYDLETFTLIKRFYSRGLLRTDKNIFPANTSAFFLFFLSYKTFFLFVSDGTANKLERLYLTSSFRPTNFPFKEKMHREEDTTVHFLQALLTNVRLECKTS